MKILDYMKDNILYLDGGLGTLLQANGMKPGEHPERWNVSHPEVVTSIHKAYYDAGSNVVVANTFGANSLKFEDSELKILIHAAVDNIKRARDTSIGKQEKFIGVDIGSLGRMLKPYGDLDFEEAVSIFSKTVKIAEECGIDMFFIETMNDSYETKCALLAVKENSKLPVFVSNAYSEDGKLMTGATPAAMVALLEGMGADAIGVNCSLGPAQLEGVIDEYLKYASVPVIFKPNAGIPSIKDGKACYDLLAEEFSSLMVGFVKKGVCAVGGCCGTTPEYIKGIVKKTAGMVPVPVSEKNHTLISSYTHAVEFGKKPVLIGERINPTGKKRLKEALRASDVDYILNEGLSQQENGAHVLDVNVGLPGIDETVMLKRICTELQAIIELPLQLDTSNIEAMEAAMRCYNGKAMINSVNGKKESMESIFPLVRKYGGLVVCLTLDEDGIPETTEGRFRIAERIIETAERYGIKKKDLIFDTLAMAVSADTKAALTTLASLNKIRDELGCNTSLGVSNISFGLPNRDIITAAFFTIALENRLSAAIMNPMSAEMMKVYYSFCVLHGLDDNCAEYISKIGKYAASGTSTVPGVSVISGAPAVPGASAISGASAVPGASAVLLQEDKKIVDGAQMTPLMRAVVKGLKEQAAALTVDLLKTKNPLDVVNDEIIPAIDIVGAGFEKKTFYLPQLLMSAEAAKCAFEQVKNTVRENNQTAVSKGTFVISTVHGDIHDIGKNIVKLILENYGFEVIDLGKDVPPEDIVKAVKQYNAPLVGLSALMTTTVPAMEETIKQLRRDTPWVKIAVGGAVLTAGYAAKIGADFYGKDAMATVRYAIKVVG